jgi:endopeptidase La
MMNIKAILNYENIKCDILKNEYKILSILLCDLQNVIIKNEIILLFSKNQCMKLLNDLIKRLNENYNKSIIEIYSNEKLNNDEQYKKTMLKNDSLYGDISELKNELSDKKSDNNSSNDNDDNINEKKTLEKQKFNILTKDIVNPNIKQDNKNKKSNNKNDYKKHHINAIKKNNEFISCDMDITAKLIDDVKHIFNENHCNNFGKYSELVKFIKYEPFEDIKKQIILLCKIVGFTNISDIFFLIFKIKNIVIENNENSKLELLNQVFTPLDFEIIDNTINMKKNRDYINIEKIECGKYISIFNNECLVSIEYNDKIIKINGFIKNDPLNIFMRTSQISNNFLYEKKIIFESIIKSIETNNKDNLINCDLFLKIQYIKKDFAEAYFKNMTITDILILSQKQFIAKLFEDHNKFLELNKIQLVKLLKIFTKNANENFYTMFNTIKLLLLGSDENCSIASLLFNLLKDKKNPNSNEYISNIIYEQLNYISQLKLKKSSINIKNELDKIKGFNTTDIDLKKQVLLSKNMPDFIKKICLEKLEELKNSNNETYKIKMYVNILVQFPWPSEFDDNLFKLIAMDKYKSKDFLETIENKLNDQVYGHELAKTKTLQMLAKLISVQGSNIHPIALSGPAGVGKTKFAQCLAECLDIPFVQITLGGQNDGELLHGHGYTYSGSQPGLIVKKMVEAGSARCIMYFDELDKCVSKNGQVNELMSILIHLTDPMTNASFQDRFFQEITFPLNKVIFIFSFNDISKIDKILLDRMEVLEISSYNLKEKNAIAKNYLLKQICKDVGFDNDSIVFTTEIINHIIENYTYEPGVRALRCSLENIFLKLNIDKIYQRELFSNDITYSKNNPLIITNEIITNVLGEVKIEYKCIHSRDIIGMINGLYATSSCSGGIVPIQISANHFGISQKFVLKLTGNQKKIMRESIIYSFTSAINLLIPQAKEDFFNKYQSGLHIHTPEAATPKDGPSAGVAFTLAFLSVMLDLKINREIALTGEIDLHGYVSKIGGVRYKVPGGFKAGVKKIFLPIDNKEDCEKLQKEMEEIFDNEHTCEYVDHVLDVAEKALIDWNTKKHLVIKKN